MELSSTEREKILIKRIVEGDEQAFSILFFNYISVLQSFALKFTRSEHAAEEIIQDAFIRIWLNRDKLEHVENIKAYLYKYVSNECLSYIRKKSKEAKVIDLFKNRQAHSENVTIDSVHLNEINRIVMSAVNKLPAQRKIIYELSRGQGKNIPEIAEILGISQNTVKNALVIALKSIRNSLIQHGIALSSLFLLEIFNN